MFCFWLNAHSHFRVQFSARRPGFLHNFILLSPILEDSFNDQILPENPPTYALHSVRLRDQASFVCLCKGPDTKYFTFYRLQVLCHNY